MKSRTAESADGNHTSERGPELLGCWTLEYYERTGNVLENKGQGQEVKQLRS